jgi:spore coat polysaccharide biosynthesis protein SpsF
MVAAIIQARMGSTRLPGKSSHLLAGLSMLEHIINRLQEVLEIDRIQLATTQAKTETPLIEIAKKLNIHVFQGSEDNVLDRFIQAGKTIGAQHLVRVCGDNPLIDIPLLRSLITAHIESNADYTVPNDQIPLGVGCEVIRLETLKNIEQQAHELKYQEHVTTWIHDHYDKFAITRVEPPAYLKNCPFRLTVDTPEDFALMKEIFYQLNPIPPSNLDLNDVIKFLDANPQVSTLNSKIKQKDWRAKN